MTTTDLESDRVQGPRRLRRFARLGIRRGFDLGVLGASLYAPIDKVAQEDVGAVQIEMTRTF